MITVTFGESFEIQSTFHWNGTIQFNRATLGFWSDNSYDLEIARQLARKFPKDFINFMFYKEDHKDCVMFTTDLNSIQLA